MLIFYFQQLFPFLLNVILEENNQIFFLYKKVKNFENFVYFLNKHFFLVCDQVLDLWAIDFPQKYFRFLLTYKFSSLFFNFTLFLRLPVLLENNKVKSLTLLFSSLNWLEREVWDMFGIFFENHLDLRRILTDYGFLGYPLRKDFPLLGFVEIKYSLDFSCILLDSIELVQEFRSFDIQSPWLYQV